jgi:hypothetical protein
VPEVTKKQRRDNERRVHLVRGWAWWVGVLAALALTTDRTGATPASYQYEVLALLGTQAPGGGALRGGFRPGTVGDGGEVAYVAGVGSRASPSLFVDTPDVAIPVARSGDPAIEGWSFAEMPASVGGIASPVSMNRAGDLVFAADLTRDGTSGAGVFRWEQTTGTLSAIQLPGQPGPGSLRLGNAAPRPEINAAGSVAFAAVVGGHSSPDVAAPTGIFIQQGGTLQTTVLPGDSMPGGGKLKLATRPSLNEQGAVAFEAEVEDSGASRTGLFLADGGVVQRVVIAGSPALDGSLLKAVREPRLNDRGQIAFYGDTGEWAVYLAQDGQVLRLAGPGSALPFGLHAQAVVTGEGSLALNELGDVAMVMAVEQPAARGVFLWTHGALTAVALPGTFLAGVGPVDDVGDDLALNNLGQVAFQAELADGDVALVLATPVPSGG